MAVAVEVLSNRQLPLSALYLLLISLPVLVASYLYVNTEAAGCTIAWSVAQWMPVKALRSSYQQGAWDCWDGMYGKHTFYQEDIPTVDVQKYKGNLSNYLTEMFGKDWRNRPLLLKNLWTAEELQDRSRKLSLGGLLQENLSIPYFTDARLTGALSPDDHGAVRDIVRNMTLGQKPHKIGSQLLVQTYPDLIREVAPFEIVTSLFGNYFSPDNVKGTGPMGLLPALTTVPLFVANHLAQHPPEKNVHDSDNHHDSTNNLETPRQPFTALHCEPIGSIAVQLSGQKQWTLVRSEFWKRVKPSVSPDGRAFFASWASNYSNVPTYSPITTAGDAIWVPTWTWHRVDYIESEDIAIGASLFHFRAVDFVRINPLFAVLMIPAMILELVGYNTQ